MEGNGNVPAVRLGTEENPLIHPMTKERLVFLRRSADTGGELLELQLSLAPGGRIATTHVHPEQEERFEVGATPVMMRIGRVERMYQPGETVVVPPGVPHVWWNPSDQEATTLVQFRPALDTETFFETFFGLAADGKANRQGVLNPLHMMVLGRVYRREVA
ncbi:MAG TPA: cupin domain-containing protein, partial [Candidatus Limnocylindria bacterium]|nr:cupin domain-containing protein [Candidatus Limnocylindria bacterium]